MKKSELVYLTREEILDFLLENWTEQMRILKKSERRSWLETQHPHNLLAVALSLCSDYSLTKTCVNSMV